MEIEEPAEASPQVGIDKTSKRWHCEICDVTVRGDCKSKHLRTAKHQRNLEEHLLRQQGVQVPRFQFIESSFQKMVGPSPNHKKRNRPSTPKLKVVAPEPQSLPPLQLLNHPRPSIHRGHEIATRMPAHKHTVPMDIANGSKTHASPYGSPSLAPMGHRHPSHHTPHSTLHTPQTHATPHSHVTPHHMYMHTPQQGPPGISPHPSLRPLDISPRRSRHLAARGAALQRGHVLPPVVTSEHRHYSIHPTPGHQPTGQGHRVHSFPPVHRSGEDDNGNPFLEPFPTLPPLNVEGDPAVVPAFYYRGGIPPPVLLPPPPPHPPLQRRSASPGRIPAPRAPVPTSLPPIHSLFPNLRRF